MILYCGPFRDDCFQCIATQNGAKVATFALFWSQVAIFVFLAHDVHDYHWGMCSECDPELA